MTCSQQLQLHFPAMLLCTQLKCELEVAQMLQRFAVQDMSNFYLDVAKDRLYVRGGDSTDRRFFPQDSIQIAFIIIVSSTRSDGAATRAYAAHLAISMMLPASMYVTLIDIRWRSQNVAAAAVIVHALQSIHPAEQYAALHARHLRTYPPTNLDVVSHCKWIRAIDMLPPNACCVQAGRARQCWRLCSVACAVRWPP